MSEKNDQKVGYKYYADVDSVYINLGASRGVTSKRTDFGVDFDLDENGKIVGIDISGSKLEPEVIQAVKNGSKMSGS